MYVCLCKAVSDKQITQAVNDKKVKTMRDLRAHFGVGSQCGVCTRSAKVVMQEAITSRKKANQTTVSIAAPLIKSI